MDASVACNAYEFSGMYAQKLILDDLRQVDRIILLSDAGRGDEQDDYNQRYEAVKSHLRHAEEKGEEKAVALSSTLPEMATVQWSPVSGPCGCMPLHYARFCFQLTSLFRTNRRPNTARRPQCLECT